MTYTLHYHLRSLQVLLTLTGQEHGFLLDGLHAAHMKEKKTCMDVWNQFLNDGNAKQHDENTNKTAQLI